MIDKAKQRFSALRLPIKAMVANTEALPFEDGEFDIVLSESVIVFTNLSLTLPEFKRVLKPTGRLLAIEMVVENSLTKADKEEIMQFYQIPRLLSEKEWYKELQRAGFTQIKMEKQKENPYVLGLQNIPDFAFSEEIDNQLYNVMAKHKWLSMKLPE